MEQLLHSFKKDNLNIKVFKSELIMAQSAVDFVVEHINKAIVEKGSANLILATGTSQFSFLDALKKQKLDWQKITVFHLDEYIGLSDKHPASFRKYLNERILDIVSPGKVYLIKGDSPHPDREIKIYENLLKSNTPDVACIGIGENGHIAFNDPPVADFNDPYLVKIVELDETCRNQQINEGWFSKLEDVPKKAVTLTIPAIMSSKTISCFVPEGRKAQAVYDTINGSIDKSCPASILRKHNDTVLFLDEAAASGIS